MGDLPLQSIVDLPRLSSLLPPSDRERFDRIYRVSVAEAAVLVPEPMRAWVQRQFGSVRAVECQQVVRVGNRITGEAALFNGLRGHRPVAGMEGVDYTAELAKECDTLADPWSSTPEDPFGRIQNGFGLTAANVAKFDALHSLVVFRDPDPLAFSAESVAGHFELALRWIQEAHRWDPAARYPFFLWNCLWRGGGSLVHGHLQVVLGRDVHYARIERFRSDAEAYRRSYGAGYFHDLIAVHQGLGLAQSAGQAHVLAHLTPLRDKEVLVVAPTLNEALGFTYQALAALRDRAGVRSFTLGAAMPPVSATSESWEGFPVLIRIVDRGSLGSRTSDVGGMELFAEGVVPSDPFRIMALLKGEEG